MNTKDRLSDIPEEEFEEIADLAEVSIKVNENWETFILSHRPLLCWEGSEKGYKHVFGHIHSCDAREDTCENGDAELVKLLSWRPMYDVGVDNNNYKPISVEEVLEKIKNKIKNE